MGPVSGQAQRATLLHADPRYILAGRDQPQSVEARAAVRRLSSTVFSRRALEELTAEMKIPLPEILDAFPALTRSFVDNCDGIFFVPASRKRRLECLGSPSKSSPFRVSSPSGPVAHLVSRSMTVVCAVCSLE